MKSKIQDAISYFDDLDDISFDVGNEILNTLRFDIITNTPVTTYTSVMLNKVTESQNVFNEIHTMHNSFELKNKIIDSGYLNIIVSNLLLAKMFSEIG